MYVTMAALMSFPANNYAIVFRYTCEQGQDIHGYGWDEFDARTGGVQTIHDEGNGLDVTISFIKVPGGSHGGSWGARIKATVRDDAPPDSKYLVHYYVAQEELGDLIVQGDDNGGIGFEGDVTFKGSSHSLGDYNVVITKGTGNHPTSDHEISATRRGDTTVVRSVSLPAGDVWQAKPAVFQFMQDTIKDMQQDYDEENFPPPWQIYRIKSQAGGGNAHVVQKVFEGGFEFDIIFSSASAGKEMTSKDITREIKVTSESFGERFSSVFDFKAPYTAEKYQKFGKSMFSNLIGGIGYFHGHQLIDRSYADEYEEDNEGFWEDTAEARARKAQELEGPYELFTSVPSRPFFPRGFFWDEGFHLIPIADWDIDLTLEIVKSWYNTMDSDGWIPREQILGPEARSKVPPEFQVQYPHYANPPTLFLIIEDFMERLRSANGSAPAEKEKLSQGHTLYNAHLDNLELGGDFLQKIYPLLRRQYDWFRKTQRGQIKAYDREAFSSKEAYRWRGRTETHCLTSGLDDYPRPQPPHPGELHVDLMSWVGFMTKSLINIADALNMADEIEELKKNLFAIERNLDDLHWSEKEGCYCDASIDEFEEHALVCHKGYISLFPFLVGLIQPDDAKLGKILDLVGDEDHLFSPHGLRSLSKQDPLYGTEENYWRSPVWMPLNYMALTQLYVSVACCMLHTVLDASANYFFLQKIGTQEGPFQRQARGLYNKLRTNLVDTVYKSWEETGFAWEQYNPETGAGQRTQHFTGWTSLVVKIMAMEPLDEAVHIRDEL